MGGRNGDTQTLYLLDATLLFFRALYGMPDVFQDGAGRSVNGLRGYLSYLLNLLRGEGSTGLTGPVRHAAAAFDESLNTCWRNALYPDYKANRPPADENVSHQLARAGEITQLLGIPVLKHPDYEADDFIAALSKGSRRPVIIVSRDKDLQQLLTDGVSLLDPADGACRGPADFRETFGFEPPLFPDYQAFTGDSVDNVPGIRGVGPKAAGALIRRFGPLEAVYEAAGAWGEAGIKPDGKVAQRMLEDREAAFLFRHILRLDATTPHTLGTTGTELQRPDGDALWQYLDAWQLRDGLGGALIRAMEAFVD